MTGLTVSEEETPKWTFGLSKISTVSNAHKDDIHGIIQLSDGTFVTGSKDGSLKKWDFAQKIVRSIFDPVAIDYRNWITALAVLNDQSWLSGNRQGRVYKWQNDGAFSGAMNTWPQLGASHKCKDRNSHRVNCLVATVYETNKPLFFVGWPTQFTLHNHETTRRLNYTKTSDNDWVYAIHPITEVEILVVTGCRFELWIQNQQTNIWRIHTRLIEEDTIKQPRPYISSITPLEGKKGYFGLAVFDGTAKVMDIERRKIIFNGAEHKNRVWTIENLTPNVFGSCGDDGTIKLWDLRKSGSIATAVDNPQISARVSVLHRYKENQLISGSCPDNVRETKEKALLSLWDLRRFGT